MAGGEAQICHANHEAQKGVGGMVTESGGGPRDMGRGGRERNTT